MLPSRPASPLTRLAPADLALTLFAPIDRLQKLAKDEEKARKDAATKAEADAAKAKHAAHELEVAKKREDDRLKREAERTARAAELAKKEEEKKKRQAEEREREAEQQRKKKERFVASRSLFPTVFSCVLTTLSFSNLQGGEGSSRTRSAREGAKGEGGARPS